MNGVIAFVVRGRTQAVLVATLAMLLPLTSFVSGAVVGLVTLRYGMADGALVLVATLAASSGLGWLVLGELPGVMAFAVLLGLPVLLLAGVLRATGSQGVMVSAAGLLGTAVIAGIHLLTGDPAAWWRGLLERQVLGPARAAEPPLDPEVVRQLGQWLDALAPWMSLFVVWAVITAVLVLFLARVCQARLDNPGGFGTEFRGLRLDRRVGYVTIAVAVLALVGSQWAGGLWAVLFNLLVALYALQGIAVAHASVAHYRASAGWLVLMYVVLLTPFVSPLALVPLAVAGFSDNWMDYRRRFGASS